MVHSRPTAVSTRGYTAVQNRSQSNGQQRNGARLELRSPCHHQSSVNTRRHEIYPVRMDNIGRCRVRALLLRHMHIVTGAVLPGRGEYDEGSLKSTSFQVDDQRNFSEFFFLELDLLLSLSFSMSTLTLLWSRKQIVRFYEMIKSLQVKICTCNWLFHFFFFNR